MQAMLPATDTPVLAYQIERRRYLNITDRCTLRCGFCPKHRDGGPRVHGYDLRLRRRPDTGELIAAVGEPAKYRELVFCGFGEPTLRLRPLLDIADYVQAHGGRVRLNTDGLANLVHKRNILPQLAGRIDALSVSMNTQNESLYRRHCRPTLTGSWDAMQDFLSRSPEYITDVTATAIDGLAGVEIAACRELAERLGVKFRRRVLDVVG